ncbi:Major intrinsic protein [Parasponia andersonii]|uniref:Major intrinsic protein n=1 Tax=Parasponia andersonii TaxID=3476 RepID=A0A2P5E3P4_PARAD|nr:Major intrinsic protein [Parasponia andersonii]
MKGLIEEQPSPDTSNYASTSSETKDDQEIGTNIAMSKSVGVLKNSAFSRLSKEMDTNFARAVVAEMVGTFILVFCVCGIIASTQKMRGQVDLLEYATTAGLTVIVLIFSIGSISGAHVNPAVTMAFAIFGHFPWPKVPLYIFAQTVGSTMATYIGKLVYNIKSDLMLTRPLQGCVSAFWVELIATFIIMFLVASLTYQAQCVGYLSGFVVGIAIGLAVLITGPVSGGSMNPARSVGAAIVSWNFTDIWIYITAPTIGAVGGSLLFQFLRVQHRPCSSATSTDTCLLSQSLDFRAS